MNQASLTDELIADSLDGSLAPEAPRAFLSWLRNEMRPASLRSDFRAHLADLRLPTLILQGAGDWLAPPRHARAAGLAIPRAEYRELPTWHLIPRERPAEVESIIRAYLDRLVPTPD
jgi:pimeloyl-ACP methyl ester carboxylesterase